MRLTQSASVSSSKRGNGNRLGVRTRKKHKRLDAISEDVFNRNRRVETGLIEGSRGESVGNDESELRRSSRARRAPVVLDSSPPPSTKRQKIDNLGRKGEASREKLKEKGRSKGKVENEVGGGSCLNSSEEELGAWRLRLRRRGRGGYKPSGKRKLFEDVEEGEEEMGDVKNERENEMPHLADEESGVAKAIGPGIVGGLIDHVDELDDDHSVEEKLENGADDLSKEDASGCVPSTSGRRDRNEEVVEGSPVHLAEKESDTFTEILLKEKVNSDENLEECKPNDELENSSDLVEGGKEQPEAEEVAALPTDAAEYGGNNGMNKITDAEAEVKEAELEKGAKVGNCNVAAGGFPRPRIKEGRRCGLCGGRTDGKPPKRLANDSAGSDREAYSGSSASEECNYDAWDGFGDEPGWLGRLLGPINDRYGIAGVWVHQHCAVWSPEVYFAGLGCLKNIRAALCRGRALKCTRCARPGATLGCRVDRCPRTYHLPCARASGCNFDHRKFLIACADHRYLFEPHGYQYAKRVKKLKAKKMRLEMRKVSNDASRKDLEAEEKWLEKCGEDEEFLRRETKRLQRDLLRIAPVYIGGSHSEGENPFEGWGSVAGLQGVVQCMKEVVILPLLYPEFFENMGITPPRGVLLHGYPGTGKTLVVRALIGSCARGDKRIAYFSRKGADCLGKYVGDAERQLRLLFQVAEKSQPSIIFFDEIDGLAPVRTRQQDQTHSSVVSTLLALMDGLKSRGSVVVIGATNRPDSVDPALRRPGRFDREIYFPLPSVKDRAAILALHTRKWPKPVAGPLLEWVATKTVGFAGADLQALCAQAAVIALKRNCSWHQILSSAGDNYVQGKRAQLPSFLVEERDWLEALSLAPPPCSRREAGMAANEVIGTPLHMHLIPCLLQPLLSLLIPLYLHERIWLPRRLVNAGAAIKRAVVSAMEKKSQQSDRWWCHVQSLAQDSDIARDIVRNLFGAGILDGDPSFAGSDLSNDSSLDDGRFYQCSPADNPSGLLRNVCCEPMKKIGYRILISGDPKSGQKHLASCILNCFVGNIEMQKIDLATISQEGHGDMAQGISHILMKCASLRLCAIVMPRVDLWAIQSCSQSFEKGVEGPPNRESSKESSSTSCQIAGEDNKALPSTPESADLTVSQDKVCYASQTWKSFVEQLECICASSSLILLATSELPCSALPGEIRQFFGAVTPEDADLSGYGTPRFSVELNGELDRDLLIHSSALDLTRDLIQQYVQLVHLGNHGDSSTADKVRHKVNGGMLSRKTELQSVEELREIKLSTEDSLTKLPVPSGDRIMKGKSTLVFAITTFGYQILRYPHFAELCWVTSKLTEGPSADIRGPWKGWPFNSCIVRPCKLIQNDTVACTSNNTKGKDKFTLVRGLIAVGLSAYRGLYTSSADVSLEVRKVMELLVGQIGARIQGGKDRYQYIHLLSQIAHLEDMVNNWSHSLRSLEPDAQISAMKSKINGAQSPDYLQTPAAKHMQLQEEPNIQVSRFEEIQDVTGGLQGSIAESSGPANVNARAANPMHVEEERDTEGGGFQDSELVEVGFQGSIARSSRFDDSNTKAVGVVMYDSTSTANHNEMSPKRVVSANHIAPNSYPAEEVANKMGSPNKVAWASNFVSSADFEDSGAVSQACSMVSNEKNSTKHEVSSPKHLEVEDLTVVCGQMQATLQSNQLPSTESLNQQIAGTCKLGNVGLCRSTELCSQSSTGPVAENEISAEARKELSDVHLSDSKFPSESASETVCSYSCCILCIHNLRQLVKKIITRELELSASSCTVEDVHDLVLSLSARLCSTIRKLYVTGQRRNSANGELRSETFNNLFESQEADACRSPGSENKLNKLVDCVCHPEKDVSEEVNPSSFSDQLPIHPRYIFKDGVLVSADIDEESSFHCKYNTLCLSSLIELMVRTKQPLDGPAVDAV